MQRSARLQSVGLVPSNRFNVGLRFRSRQAPYRRFSKRTMAIQLPLVADIDVVASASLLSEIVRALVGQTASVLPAPIQPILTVVGGDVASLLSLKLNPPGLVRLGLLYYSLFTRPSPVGAILDFYLLGPVSALLGKKYSESDFTLRDRLGGGNYGQGNY